MRPVELFGDRRDLLLGELADGSLEQAVMVRQIELHAFGFSQPYDQDVTTARLQTVPRFGSGRSAKAASRRRSW